MNTPRLLLIEDEKDLRTGLTHNLELEGFKVDTAADGDEGLRKALELEHDLILLDLMLPGLQGHEVLRQLRDAGRRMPIIVLSAKDAAHDKVTCLEAGADDYVTKPFGLEELFARIRAVLRRIQEQEPAPRGPLHFHDLTIDFRRFTVERDGTEHSLSRFEAEILQMLIQRRGEVVTRKDLLTEVWGYTHLPNTRTVDNHIARLRKKIEANADSPIHVVTVHGIGYRFDSEELP